MRKKNTPREDRAAYQLRLRNWSESSYIDALKAAMEWRKRKAAK